MVGQVGGEARTMTTVGVANDPGVRVGERVCAREVHFFEEKHEKSDTTQLHRLAGAHSMVRRVGGGGVDACRGSHAKCSNKTRARPAVKVRSSACACTSV